MNESKIGDKSKIEEMGRKAVGDGTSKKKGRLVPRRSCQSSWHPSLRYTTDYFYDCTCGGKPEYVGSEWKWRCPECGATNYEPDEIRE